MPRIAKLSVLTAKHSWSEAQNWIFPEADHNQGSIFSCRPRFVFTRCNMFVWPWGKCPGWKELGPIKSQLSAFELNGLDTVVFLMGSVNRICIKAISRSIVYQWRSHKPLRGKPLIKPTLPFLEMPVISLSTIQAVIQEVKERLHYASPSSWGSQIAWMKKRHFGRVDS